MAIDWDPKGFDTVAHLDMEAGAECSVHRMVSSYSAREVFNERGVL